MGPDLNLTAGEFLVEDISGAQIMVMAGGGEMRPLTEKRTVEFSESSEVTGLLVNKSTRIHEDGGPTLTGCTSILIIRTGGLGDNTLLTPVLREIKRRWPNVRIAHAGIKDLQQSIQNLPFIDELISYPVPLAKAQEYDGWIFLEGAIENNEDAKTLHSVDAVAKFIGLPLPEDCDKVQAYVPTQAERSWVLWAYPRIPGIKRLCVQMGASAKCRTYPLQKTNVVVTEMLKKGWEVFLLGAKGEIAPQKDPIPGLRIVSDNATFRQRAALIETADCFVGPDSSLVHIAGALNVPAIGLFGPFHWNVRTKYNPLTVGMMRLEGFSCAPCFHHALGRKQFPANCPTASKGFCGPLDAIKPESIVAKIEEIARGGDDKVVAFEPAGEARD
jgi:ADP-heptose:LPS heptosyltransferase